MLLMEDLPTLEQQVEFFDHWNESYRREGFQEIEPESRARGERVLVILESLRIKGVSILEVGCGTGWLTERLVQFGPTTAIDLSPRAITIARSRDLNAEFLSGDFFTQEFSQAKFELVICLETISHVPDQQRFVARLATVTHPNGYLIITAQNKFVYERRSDIGPPKPGSIRKWLTGKQLRQLLAPRFRVLQSTTVLPKGDMGILRLVHSYKVNRLLELAFSRASIIRTQERLGLGHTRVVLAQRRDR
jgi:2-polyprenyl-3-methyl-5-hydroxy-6-metoxy-1,4-benzoquinol methylase